MSMTTQRSQTHPTPVYGRQLAQRRGVLLLVVLSMLTLFMLLGTTFVILASRTRTTSRAILRSQAQQSRNSVSIQPILRSAAMQVFRGTTNTTSVLRGHDLLADRYGNTGGVERYVYDQNVKLNPDPPRETSLVFGGQILKLSLYTDKLLNTATSEQLTGQVLTFLDGPQGVAGTSARIIETRFVSGAGNTPVYTNDIYLVRPPALEAGDIDQIKTVWITNREFTGRGLEFAESMLPNVTVGTWTPPNGEPNEDYDRFDPQNIALSSPDGTSGPVPSFHRPTIAAYWLRQYGRAVMARDGHASRADFTVKLQNDALADLHNELLSGTGTTPPLSLSYADRLIASIPARLRRSFLRPFPYDHASDGVDFSGKPLSTELLDRPLFDVDNDGDGQLDSVWLDIGYPPFQIDEQTFLKPLVAIKCVDLDGRINLNAHATSFTTLPDVSAGVIKFYLSNKTFELTGNEPLRPGMAFGPGDVRLRALLADTTDDRRRFSAVENIFFGSDATQASTLGFRRSAGNFLGRYGDEIFRTFAPGSFGFPTDLPRPGTPNTAEGISGYHFRRHDPAEPQLGLTDYWSQKFPVVDTYGNLVFMSLPTGLSDETDSPYEFDLYAAKDGDASADTVSALDQPFTPAELEALLRPFDADSTAILPQRALTIAASAAPDVATPSFPDVRHLFTTESWDTPAIIGTPLADLNLDPDLLRGLRMELNRPLGDGINNNFDPSEPTKETAFDEPGESGDSYQGWYDDDGMGNKDVSKGSPLTRGMLPPAMRLANPISAIEQEIQRNGHLQPSMSSPGIQARQLMAMHIYKLLRYITDTYSTVTFADGTTFNGLPLFALKTGTDSAVGGDAPIIADGTGNWTLNPKDPNADKNRILAQWAVNIVDFFDNDAIMTPFCYADADTLVQSGVIQPRSLWMQHVVWGCERPELVITETLATHDLGLADIDPKTGDGLEQVRVPEGSLYVELKSIRSPNEENFSSQLHTQLSGDTWSLSLEKRPAGVLPGEDPVWRLALTRATPSPYETFDVLRDHPDSEWFSPNRTTDDDGALTELGGFSAERYVWFTKELPTRASGPGPTKFNTYSATSATNELFLEPGETLVIGSRVKTHFGSKSGSYGDRSRQNIHFPAPDVVEYHDADGLDVRYYAKTRTVDSSIKPTGWTNFHRVGMSISEPPQDAYYPEPDGAGKTYTAKRAPVDSYLAPGLRTEGTHPNVSTAFLQRLADPTRPHDPRAMIPPSTGGADLVFNPDWNPYITVDFMPIDLHVFNGETPASGSFHFGSRERGYDNDPSGTKKPLTAAWRPFNPAKPFQADGPPVPTSKATTKDAGACFPYNLENSLGVVNLPLGIDRMPSIPWNDRPFANAYELLLVPRTPASRLLTNFRTFDPTKDSPSITDVKEDPLGANSYGAHLMPLTSMTDPPITNPSNPSDTLRPNADVLSHLFNYVHVRTRFRGATQPLANVSGPPTTTDPSVDPTILFRPPFHTINQYREPGRVNINSIADSRVWKALLGHDASTTPSPDWVQTDPASGDPDSPGMTDITARMLNRFQLPASGDVYPNIRGPLEREAADYVPFRTRTPLPNQTPPDWAVASLTPPSASALEWSVRSTRRANMLTSDWFDDDDPTTSPPVAGDPPDALFRLAPDTANPAVDPARQTWHAFEPLIRAGANSTTRSEVYALHLTLGLFEVERRNETDVVPDYVNLPAPPGDTFQEGVKRYPDNWKLIREYGSQNGSVERHKAFFIFDRSRPIAYETGSDHNIDDAILIERYIQ